MRSHWLEAFHFIQYIMSLRVLLFMCAALVAFIFAYHTDMRIFLLWVILWQFNFWLRRWWRNLLVLGTMAGAGFITHLLIPAPQAAFFMSLVLLFAASEFSDTRHHMSPFGFVGVIFPALSILVLSPNTSMFILLMFLIILFALIFALDYNKMSFLHMRVRFVPLLLALSVAFVIAVLGFILVPRIELPKISGLAGVQTVSGVPQDLDLTQFGALLENHEIMFRGIMARPLPKGETPYWRVHVLSVSEGAHWRRHSSLSGASLSGAPLPVLRDAPSKLRITHEVQILHDGVPKHGSYPVLGIAARPPKHTKLRLTPNREIIAASPITAPHALPKRLALEAYFSDVVALSMPSHFEVRGAPRLVEWARALRHRSVNHQDFARRLLRHFATQNYQYSLSPSVLAGDVLDDFFFRVRAGYCSHYAMVMAVALRAGGVAANVITGYAGGQWNEYGRYYIVRASDAHAWVEAELTPGVWTRFDPTNILPARQDSADNRRAQDDMRGMARLFARQLDRLDAFLLQINQEVLLYDAAARRDLLRDVRARFVFFLKIWGIMSAAFLLLLLGVRLFIRAPHLHNMARAFERLGARAGVVHHPYQGWLAFARVWGVHEPKSATAVMAFAHYYCRLVFGNKTANTDDYRALHRLLRQIKDEK